MVMNLQYILGIAVFACTVIAYAIFLILGKIWRRDFEAEGIKYWTTPKGERVSILINSIWKPRLVASLYTLAYFTNGYTRVTFSIWIPFFLLNQRGLDTVEAALFVGLIYVSWSWKMFIGIVMDAFPLNFRGNHYRRLPWFFLAGLLYVISALLFLVSDPNTMPIWALFFPTILLVTTAGAILDISADSYAVDATPPEWHGRVLGTASRLGRVIGGGLASILPPYLLRIGDYKLVFLVASITGLAAFLCLVQKEPTLEKERVFSREAIAFTFTEKTVLIGCLTMFIYSFSLRPIASSLGGMFAFILKEIVGVSPDLVGRISLITLLSGFPASILGGWASDKWGHKRVLIASSLALGASGLLWINLKEGLVYWFTVSAIILNFFYTINLASLLALMGDITPLALSSTVYQMYMSFIWIGNIPVSVIVGYLISVNLQLCIALMIFFTLLMAVIARGIEPYEIGKATIT
jgi:MFS family permease